MSDCDPPGLLAAIVSIDLFGVDEMTARSRLLEMVTIALGGRAKPAVAPRFPGDERALPNEPPFPGGLPEDQNQSSSREKAGHTVTHLSVFRRRGGGTAPDAPDPEYVHDLITELLRSAELLAASYPTGDEEYTWTRLGLDAQLTGINMELEQITQWLARTGMTGDLSAFDLEYSLRLYAGTASEFVRALRNLEPRRSPAEKRILLTGYEAAERSLEDLLWRIHQEFTKVLRASGLPGQR